MDREEHSAHLLLVKASEDCNKPPANQSFFDATDDTLLKIAINVVDENDNPPLFVHRVFTGGVSTGASFGTEFMMVKVSFIHILILEKEKRNHIYIYTQV